MADSDKRGGWESFQRAIENRRLLEAREIFVAQGLSPSSEFESELYSKYAQNIQTVDILVSKIDHANEVGDIPRVESLVQTLSDICIDHPYSSIPVSSSEKSRAQGTTRSKADRSDIVRRLKGEFLSVPFADDQLPSVKTSGTLSGLFLENPKVGRSIGFLFTGYFNVPLLALVHLCVFIGCAVYSDTNPLSPDKVVGSPIDKENFPITVVIVFILFLNVLTFALLRVARALPKKATGCLGALLFLPIFWLIVGSFALPGMVFLAMSSRGFLGGLLGLVFLLVQILFFIRLIRSTRGVSDGASLALAEQVFEWNRRAANLEQLVDSDRSLGLWQVDEVYSDGPKRLVFSGDLVAGAASADSGLKVNLLKRKHVGTVSPGDLIVFGPDSVILDHESIESFVYLRDRLSRIPSVSNSIGQRASSISFR